MSAESYGFILPVGTDYIREGDNAITENARLTADLIDSTMAYVDRQAPTKSALIQLSLPGADAETTETAVHVRIPVKVGARVPSFRVHFHNRNDRNDTVYPTVNFTGGVFIGPRAKDINGNLTQDFASDPANLGSISVTDLGSNGKRMSTVTKDYVLEPGVEYLLSYGYTSPAGQLNHLGIGGCYRGSVPSAAGALTASSMTQSDAVPLDVAIAAYVPADTPVFAYVGSSTVVGNKTPWPIRDSFATRHAYANGALSTLVAASGAAMPTYTDPAKYALRKAALYSRPDHVFMNLHSNDVYSTADLQTIKDRNTALMANLRYRLSDKISYINVAPRANEDAPTKVKREAYNSWLATLPNDAVATYDAASVVAGATGLDPIYNSGDGVHLNALGQAKMAEVLIRGNSPKRADQLAADLDKRSLKWSHAVGRTASALNPLNGLQQLIYGDTGLRDVTSLFSASIPTAGGAYLQRVGGNAYLTFEGITFAANGSGTPLIIPTGFRPSRIFPMPMEGLSFRAQITQYGNVQLYSWTANKAIYGTLAWPVSDPWPTSLPGTAVGGIPA